MKPSHRDAAGLALALALALAAHRFVLELELMGWDSYPTIVASRVEEPGDLLGSFTEELMDGRYPQGSFYRPVTNLVFAFDEAIWGLRPLGYQLTNLALLLAGVVAVFCLGRRWLGPGWGALIAAFVFALHPLQLETVPVAARRADMLFTLFLTWALFAQPLGTRARAAATIRGAVLVVLSAASKDTGAVALVMVAGAQWWLPGEGDAAQRTRRMLRLCAWPAAGFAAFLALRTSVLGGLGGHPGSSVLAGALRGLLRAPDFARSLVQPQPWTERPGFDAAVTLVLVAGLATSLVVAARQGRPDGAADEGERPAPARVIVFLLGWLACLLAMTGISGERASWYAVPFLPAYALLLGSAADAARRAARGRLLARAAAIGAMVGVLGASHLRYSPLFHRYEEWTQVNAQSRAFLGRLRAVLAEAEPGTRVVVTGLPLGTGAPLERVGVRSALCLSDYSVEAYAELVQPGRTVRVVLQTGDEPTPATPGIVTLDAVPLPSPVLGPPPGAPG